MAILVKTPTVVPAQGNKPKSIEEYIGRVNSDTTAVSIARMKSPAGWIEPGQCPEFDEYTLVLAGSLHAQTRTGKFVVRAGEALIALKGEWIAYSTPDAEGAEYIAVCTPAFAPEFAHRDR